MRRKREDILDTERKKRLEEITVNERDCTGRREWNVFFDGNFWGYTGKESAGEEIKVNKNFQWAGKTCLIPAVYLCGKGIVADICIRTEPEEIQSFMERWNLSPENERERHFTREEQMLLEAENPLTFDFSLRLSVNGQVLTRSHGCSVCVLPWLKENNNREEEQILAYYGLDTYFAWTIWRFSFPWKTKSCAAIQTLSAQLRQNPVLIPVSRLCVSEAGEKFSFHSPENGKACTLTVKEYKKEEVPENSLKMMRDTIFPTHFYRMSYLLEPDIPDDRIRILDCSDGDKPGKRGGSCSAAAAIGIIGGADGALPAIAGDGPSGNVRMACSSLYFELPDKTDWIVAVMKEKSEDMCLELL